MPTRKFLNPLTELTAAALLVVVVLVVNRWEFSLAVLVAVVLPAVLLSGKARQIGLAFLVLAGPMLGSLFLLHGLFYPEGSEVLAGWGVARVTAEGLHFALTMMLRVAVFTGALLAVAMTIDIPELISTMTHRGWNRKLVFVIGAALGLAPHVAERTGQITRAQQARGLIIRRGVLSRFRGLLMICVPLVMGLLVDASERASMLESRGFSATGPRTSYRPDTDTPAQRAARWAMLAAAVVFSVLWLTSGGVA